MDYLAGLSKEEKRAKLAKISYADYLTKFCKVHPEALPFFQTFPHDLYGVGIDAVPALGCFESGDDYESFTYPGFDGLGIGDHEKEEPYIFHFPDGNASIARLLVRALIPGAMPGHTMDDVVTARADYSKLDVDGAAVRMRLNSTVVHVQQGGQVRRRRAKNSEHCLHAREEVAVGAGEELRAGLLQRDDSVHLPHAAAETERSAVVSGEDAAGVYARGAAELDFVCETGRASDRGAGRLSHVHGAGFSGEHWRICVSEQSGRADGAVHAAHAVQARTADARSVSRGARGIDGHAVFEIRTQYSRPAGENAGRSGISIRRGTLRGLR